MSKETENKELESKDTKQENDTNLENNTEQNKEIDDSEDKGQRKVNNKPKKQRKVINVSKVIIWGVGLIYLITQIVLIVKDTKPVVGELSYSQVFEMLDNDEVESISIIKDSDAYTVTDKNGNTYTSVNPKSDDFVEKLMMHGASISVARESRVTAIGSLAISLPLILMLIMMSTYLTTTVVAGNTKMFTLLKADQNKTSFKDVKGLTETKQEVKFAVEQLKNWKKLEEVGARTCKGMLLYGPPGTGKTLIAKAIANEAGVPFVSASGSDFDEMFVGVGASRVRAIFTLAAENAPCILFIDEIDCLGKRRRNSAAHEVGRTLNALLQRMDGLNKINGVMVIGATNRKEDLDEALLRPGRFDRHYYIGPPKTKADRDELVEYYLSDKKVVEGVNVETVSKLCVGLTGAEIEEVMNEAVYTSLREEREGEINLADIDESIMKLHTSGVKQEHTSERDRQITAIHESGHTIVSLALGIPISKVSIIPYSSGVGGVTIRDIDDAEYRQLEFKVDSENEIKMLLGGMIAEDIEYHDHTQGCSNDLEKATERAYSLITRQGQGTTLLNENLLMNNGVAHMLHERTLEECKEELNTCKTETEKILRDNWDLVTKLSNKLLEEKTIVQPTLEKIKNY